MKEKIRILITEFNKNLTHSQRCNLKTKSSGGICDFCLNKLKATLFVPTSYKYLIHPVYSEYTMIGPCCLDRYLDRLVEEKVKYEIVNLMVKEYKDKLRSTHKKEVKSNGSKKDNTSKK